MLDDYGYELYEEYQFPLAYLITFRTYGTWLHGDKRQSVGRNGRNIYGTRPIESNVPLMETMRGKMNSRPVILTREMREVIENAIREISARKTYSLKAVNVRTNHAHSVVSGNQPPERIANDLKAYATKMLREAGLVAPDAKVWARGRSRKYLWKPRDVVAAMDYVIYGQGDVPFELE